MPPPLSFRRCVGDEVFLVAPISSRLARSRRRARNRSWHSGRLFEFGDPPLLICFLVYWYVHSVHLPTGGRWQVRHPTPAFSLGFRAWARRTMRKKGLACVFPDLFLRASPVLRLESFKGSRNGTWKRSRSHFEANRIVLSNYSMFAG